MQQINVAILNPWFFLSYLGAPVLTIVAGAPSYALTGGFSIPLNDSLAPAGAADGP